MSDEAEKNWNAALHEMAIDTMDELRAARDYWMQDSALHAQDVIRLTKANAELREALADAIYQITHLSAPRPDDVRPTYRPIIPGYVVDRWRKTLANSSEGE